MGSRTNINVEYITNMYEQSSPMPTCTVELQLRHRYQLRIPSNEGVLILVEDVVTPERRTSTKIPLLSSTPLWQELYLSRLFSGLNLDRSLLASLRSKVADTASLFVGTKSSFCIVAKVIIFTTELLSKEETDRIAAEFVNPLAMSS